MNSEKIVTLKLFDSKHEQRVNLLEFHNFRQFYSTVKILFAEEKNLAIVYKGKIVQCTDELRQVENNGILFIFPTNSPFEMIHKNPEYVKFVGNMDKIFFGPQNVHEENFLGDEIEGLQSLLRDNGVNLDKYAIIDYLEQNNGDVLSLLKQFGIR